MRFFYVCIWLYLFFKLTSKINTDNALCEQMHITNNCEITNQHAQKTIYKTVSIRIAMYDRQIKTFR